MVYVKQPIKAVYIKHSAKPRLPSEYTEVEYIQSSGSQYINSGVTLDTNDKMNGLDMYVKATHTGTGDFMGAYNGSTYVTMEVVISVNRLRCFIGNSSSYTDRDVLHSDNTTYDEIEYIYSSSLATFIVNGTTYTQSRGGGYNTGTRPILIFGSSNASSYGQLLSMKLSKCFIKIGGVLLRDFVPCYRKSDNVIGLYDLVENKFYTNSGSGTFTKGADVGQPELIQIRPTGGGEQKYIMLGDGVNRFSELTKSGNNTLMSVSDGGTYWNIFTSQTDRATTGYKVFDKEIIGFDIEWQKTEDYDYSWLTFIMQSDKGTNDVAANSIQIQNDRDTYSGRAGINIWHNGTHKTNTGTYSTAVVYTSGKKEGDVRTITSTGGISNTTTITTTDKYYRMSVGGGRWFTGTMGRVNKLIIYLGE